MTDPKRLAEIEGRDRTSSDSASVCILLSFVKDPKLNATDQGFIREAADGYWKAKQDRAYLLSQLRTAQADNARLREALTCAIGMIDNCAGVPINPDSLPQMVKHHLSAALKE